MVPIVPGPGLGLLRMTAAITLGCPGWGLCGCGHRAALLDALAGLLCGMRAHCSPWAGRETLCYAMFLA
jgi:hypothetical protein